jgi:hypothetical protein
MEWIDGCVRRTLLASTSCKLLYNYYLAPKLPGDPLLVIKILMNAYTDKVYRDYPACICMHMVCASAPCMDAMRKRIAENIGGKRAACLQ